MSFANNSMYRRWQEEARKRRSDMSEINNRGDVEERLHTEITHLKSELEKCQVERELIDKERNELDELRHKLCADNAKMRQVIKQVWDEDECGWVVDEYSVKECVKCGAKTGIMGIVHHELDCTQAPLEEALSTDCGQAFLDRLHTSEQRVKELVDLVCRLRNALVAWGPAPGDAFLIKEADTTLHKAIGEVGSK